MSLRGVVLLDAMLGIALVLIVGSSIRLGIGVANHYWGQLDTMNQRLNQAHNQLQLVVSGRHVDGVTQSPGPHGSTQHRVALNAHQSLVLYTRYSP